MPYNILKMHQMHSELHENPIWNTLEYTHIHNKHKRNMHN